MMSEEVGQVEISMEQQAAPVSQTSDCDLPANNEVEIENNKLRLWNGKLHCTYMYM